MIKALFALAREKKPSIIFIDECEALLKDRNKDIHEAIKQSINEFL